jgi:hypothetical protein
VNPHSSLYFKPFTHFLDFIISLDLPHQFTTKEGKRPNGINFEIFNGVYLSPMKNMTLHVKKLFKKLMFAIIKIKLTKSKFAINIQVKREGWNAPSNLLL